VTQVTHIVLLSWKSGRASVAEESIRPAIRAFTDTMPGVADVVEGHSSSPEGLEDGYDYGFVITFDSAQARDSYLTDSRHQVVADAIGVNAQRIVVFDI
jgi:hypothetical protein